MLRVLVEMDRIVILCSILFENRNGNCLFSEKCAQTLLQYDCCTLFHVDRLSGNEEANLRRNVAERVAASRSVGPQRSVSVSAGGQNRKIT